MQIQIYECFWREEERPSRQFVIVSPVCQPVLGGEVQRKGWMMKWFGEFFRPVSHRYDGRVQAALLPLSIQAAVLDSIKRSSRVRVVGVRGLYRREHCG